MSQNNIDKIRLMKALEKVGLTKKESEIYCAGRMHGALSVKEIVAETGIKRPTVYHALETLSGKGLVSVRDGYEGRLYVMSDPVQIKKVLTRKEEDLKNVGEEIEDLLPVFMTLGDHVKKEKIATMQFSGERGVKVAIDEALYCKSKKWKIIAPRKNFFSERADRTYADYYLQTRKQRKITAQTLWEVDEGQIKKEVREARKPRILPEQMKGKFTSVMILFDDKALLISSRKNMSAIIIESKEMSNLLSVFFDGLWAISEPKNDKNDHM